MSVYAKMNTFSILIGICLILGVESYSCWSKCVVTVQPGRSVTIPCHYDEKYTPQKKYWFSGVDKTSTFANTTEENLSVIDHPEQSLFTVTMRNLQIEHSGNYYCVVETGEHPPIKEIYEPYLKVQPAPDVSVMSSSVSGREGEDVRVQCFYSSGYQNEPKRWCRYKDQRCFTEKETDTSVQISDDDDDGERSFTVLMTGLRLSDSGWYFCSAGDRIIPVQLTVTEAESGTIDKTTKKTEVDMKTKVTLVTNDQSSNELLTVWLPTSATLLLLSVLVVVFICVWRQRSKKDEQQIRQRTDSRSTEFIYSKPQDAVTSCSINDENPNDVTYSTIGIIPGSEAEPPAGGSSTVIYSTVAR